MSGIDYQKWQCHAWAMETATLIPAKTDSELSLQDKQAHQMATLTLKLQGGLWSARLATPSELSANNLPAEPSSPGPATDGSPIHGWYVERKFTKFLTMNLIMAHAVGLIGGLICIGMHAGSHRAVAPMTFVGFGVCWLGSGILLSITLDWRRRLVWVTDIKQEEKPAVTESKPAYSPYRGYSGGHSYSGGGYSGGSSGLGNSIAGAASGLAAMSSFSSGNSSAGSLFLGSSLAYSSGSSGLGAGLGLLGLLASR
jgi:hypothetical protein